MPSDPTLSQPFVDDGDPYIPDAGSTRLSGLALGIDVGGTGVKAALVDLATAELVSPRVREKTPQPSTPDAVALTIRSVIDKVLDGRDVPADLPVGCGLPGVVKNGRLMTAANIDAGWVDWPAEERIGEAVGRRTWIINDADAAGLAEVAYGAGRDRPGTVLLLTIGTGIGSALFLDGRLVPNTEFGHLEMRGKGAETLVSGAARERRKLGWKRWATEFNDYIARVELYFSPDLLIYGGGVSKEWSKWAKWSRTSAPVVLAKFLNTSGIIGAAYAAAAAHHAELEAAGVAVGAGAGTAADAAPADAETEAHGA